MSSTLNFATVTATFTPIKSGVAPIQYKSDTTNDEDEFLGEPQPAKERGRRWMSNDGINSVTIHRFASNGKRDLMIFDSKIGDRLLSWAQQNPTVHFNLDFSYQRDELDESQRMIQRHSDCFFDNTPARVMSNESVGLKFSLNYAKLEVLNAATGTL